MRKLYAVMNTRLSDDGKWVQDGPLFFEERESPEPSLEDSGDRCDAVIPLSRGRSVSVELPCA